MFCALKVGFLWITYFPFSCDDVLAICQGGKVCELFGFCIAACVSLFGGFGLLTD